MRLDNYLVLKCLFDSRTKAKQAILRGEIYLDGKLVDKPSYDIDESKTQDVERKYVQDFVSLGGFKLHKALNDFNYSPLGKVCCDVGSSTGGFTDCLLKNGAKKVYCVDVNDELLHEKLKKDNRVEFILKNAKFLSKSDINDKIDLVTIDLSFISATSIFTMLSELVSNNTDIILLIKPQFENDKKISFKNGIIKDDKLRRQICEKVISRAIEYKLYPQNFTTAPIQDDKNIEYLIHLKKNSPKKFDLKEYF